VQHHARDEWRPYRQDNPNVGISRSRADETLKTKGGMSPQARARISAAQKRRWQEFRNATNG
jgi:hypothetical protein